jgi:hypothetical protein
VKPAKESHPPDPQRGYRAEPNSTSIVPRRRRPAGEESQFRRIPSAQREGRRLSLISCPLA